jgi:hypothetical protein
VVLDGARKLGAKMLIAGGGRCNLTHDRVEARDYAGSSRHAIQKVLRRFDVEKTIAFFAEIGVDLEREETGKLFPASNRAETVVDGLIRAARRAGATVLHPRRVDTVRRAARGFTVTGEWGSIRATRVILATGGRSFPKTGSDGHGYAIARNLGHTIKRPFPALVPLTLPRGHFITRSSGLAVETTLEVVSATGRRLASATGPTLCTHFGISGPAVLDISRHYIDARGNDPGAGLVVNWLPRLTAELIESELVALGPQSVSGYLDRRLPDRLANALCAAARVDPATRGDRLRRDDRKRLALAVTRMPLPVTGNRGFAHAEITAGGVPLAEVRLDKMESRVCPGLYLCGEICDVDGRVGGFNLQWAWASGYVAGVTAARAGDAPSISC